MNIFRDFLLHTNLSPSHDCNHTESFMSTIKYEVMYYVFLLEMRKSDFIRKSMIYVILLLKVVYFFFNIYLTFLTNGRIYNIYA